MPDHPSPLRLHAFRAIWLASIFSYVGSFIEEVGHGWLMVTLTENPLPVALMATAATVPAFTLMIPAGLLADRWDRRKLLMGSQALAAFVALVLAVATGAGLASPGVILLACAGLGVAGALSAPSWHTLVTELVPRESTAEAVAYNSIAFNVARAVGPAIGGLILGALGPVWAFSINALSFFAIIEVLRRYPEIRAASEAKRDTRRGESLSQAIIAPFRHVMNSRRLSAPFKAIALLGVPAACSFSLLPAFAKHSLGSTAWGYGSLLAGFGLGAIAGGLVLKRARYALGPSALVTVGFGLYGAGSMAMAFAPSVTVAFLCLVPAGTGWVTMSVLNATVQLASPAWAKARVMALYQVTFLVSWSVGATLAGVIARATNERVAIGLGGAGVLAAAMFVRRIGLASRDADLVAAPIGTPVPGRV
jgi:MFS family permease